MSVETGKVNFRPRARLIKTIGEELISNDVVAIIELVKNSYDADADVVEINFNGDVEEVKNSKGKVIHRFLKKDGASITITDNGTGMKLETIKDSWMEPATISKKYSKESQSKKRKVTGEKGIGRFASAKLASQLKIVTRSANENEVEANFNWDDFSDDTKYLDQVECTWEVRAPKNIKEKGTYLYLTNLNSDWDEEKLKQLRIALSRMINPISPVIDFLIDFKLPEKLKEFSGLIESPDTLNKPDYKVRGNVTDKGSAQVFYSSKNHTEEIKIIDNKNLIKEDFLPASGPFSIEFRAWDRDLDSIDDLAKKLDSTRKNIKADLDSLGGISIYRDKFRVLPYGEAKNDWLRLDLRRVQNPTMRISNNQIVGYVSVSLQTNPELKDQSNREGIVDSKSFTDLQEQIIAILNELEQKRYNERRPEDKSQTDNGKALFEDFNIAGLIDLVKTKLGKDEDAIKLVEQTETRIKEGVKKVQNVISRYRRLSTLGLLIDSVLHDGNNYIGKIDLASNLISAELDSDPASIEEIKTQNQNIQTLRKSLAQLFKRLEPFGGKKRGRPADIVLEDAILNMFELHKTELSINKISYVLPATQTIVRFDESDVQTIILNLLQNSIYWLNQQSKDSKQIEVTVERTDDAVNMVFSDSGPGVKEENIKSIFDPYFSSKKDGIGLGLTIVGEIITEYDGSLSLIDNGPLDGASFQITFKKKI
jgi:signal transduction histidine kinase